MNSPSEVNELEVTRVLLQFAEWRPTWLLQQATRLQMIESCDQPKGMGMPCRNSRVELGVNGAGCAGYQAVCPNGRSKAPSLGGT